MDLIIRPIKVEDSKQVVELRTMKGVMENTLAMPSEREDKIREKTLNLGINDYIFVAEIKEENDYKIVGIAALNVENSPRLRHSAGIGISVHTKYQGMGIGKKLLNKLLDISDNWLMLVRIELGVLCDNDKAINLYKSLGFVVEGKKKYTTIRNGKYVDEYIMGRYNENLINK
ncbi:GNAT family N-acetyltransferase [[Clostridium] dakarense]|uniref:GNAT family N-acetyltransferase n=1 Tax=Faecalimicrobium dakarense TaxID=1301100 RepID=UPI0004B11CAB|nr:GNAT family N-acetyltransferase [[Clostridium] dakarense]